MRAAEEFEGDLWLVNAGSANDQSGVTDEVAFVAATYGKQAYPAVFALLGHLGDGVPGPRDRQWFRIRGRQDLAR